MLVFTQSDETTTQTKDEPMSMAEHTRLKQLEKQGMSRSEALQVIRVERERQLLIADFSRN